MIQNYDVVIIGAGCAGLNISQKLGELGLNVCLIDSKQDLLNLSFYTLGSFINLTEVGLSTNVIATNIKECTFYSNNFSFTKTINGNILDKAKLHKELLDKAVQNHVTIWSSIEITKFEFDKDGCLDSAIAEDGNIFKGIIFVDATGSAGILSKKIGLQEVKLKTAIGLEYNVKYFSSEHKAHLFIGSRFRGGYGWIFPIGNGRAVVGYATLHKESINHLKQKLNSVIIEEPMRNLISLDNHKSFGGVIPITPVKTKFVYKNIVCVGDSVSQVNPLVGEGYRFILQASLMAAQYIKQAVQAKNLELLKGYEQDWCRKFYNSYSTSKRLRSILNFISNNDFISDIFTRFIGKLSDKKFEQILAADFH